MDFNFSIENLTLTDLNKYSVCVAQKVLDINYAVDHVLYVERAGLFLGHLIANYIDCPISGIYSSRSGSSIKSRAKLFLRHLPKCFTHLLRKIEVHSNIHRVKKDRRVHIKDRLPPHGKNILIVDDAIDTGFSFRAVYDFLLSNGYDTCDIKTAVLTTTSEAPIFKADISLFNRKLFAFPWSYDSKEYDGTWQFYKEIKDSLSL